MSADDVDSFMKLYDSLIGQYHYNPSLIFNMDETMLHPGKNYLKVIVRGTGQKLTQKIQAKGEHITFVVRVTATGITFKLIIILPLKTMPDISEKMKKQYSFVGQQSGWIDADIYQMWVRSTLILYVEDVHAKSGNPDLRALLIIDGHNSRESRVTTQLLVDNKIDCICLLAHSSTVLQPLNLTVNEEFKKLLGKHWVPITSEPKNEKHEHLLYIAELALNEACIIFNIVTGFAKAGLWPYNPQTPLQSALVRDPATQYIPERKIKKKQGVDISGKVLTDGKVIEPIRLPEVLPQPQLPAPRARKPRKPNTATTTSTAVVVVEK